MKISILIIASLLILGASSTVTWADQFPYCKEPFSYPVTLPVTATKVNLINYAGVWFEIARLPEENQEGCVSTMVSYSLNTKGYIDVENTCTTKDGGKKNAIAKAYSRNAENTKLEVFFSPNTPGNYWILEIDPYYNWAVVGEPCLKKAWIIARATGLDNQILTKRIELLTKLGFPTSSLIINGKSSVSENKKEIKTPELEVANTKVNLRNYAGVWYEIARLPSKQQEGCVSTTATYTVNTQGSVDVQNWCRTKDGSTRIINGKAVSTNDDNTKLKVQFRPESPAGDYWILEIDTYYNWVVVGEPSRKMAWILARTPVLAKDLVSKRVDLLKKLGFSTSDLIFSSV